MLSNVRIARMLNAKPLNVARITAIDIHASPDNKCAMKFIQNHLPLLAHRNHHLNIKSQPCTVPNQEKCSVSLENGQTVTLNLSHYKYPLQILQRILDLNECPPPGSLGNTAEP